MRHRTAPRKTKAEYAADKLHEEQEFQAAQVRVQEVLSIINESIKPDIDDRRRKAIALWDKARKVCFDLGGSKEKLYTLLTGRSMAEDKEPAHVSKYSRDREARKQYEQLLEEWHMRRSAYGNSKEFKLIVEWNDRTTGARIEPIYLDSERYTSYVTGVVERDIQDLLYKMTAAIVKYIGHLSGVSVKDHIVRLNVQGFEGSFLLYTDQGKYRFACRSIWAEGPIVSLHARYISNLKRIEL